MRGFTFVEVLVSLAIAALLAGAVTTVVAAVARATVAQPRSADAQQRLRAVFDAMTSWLGAAGQGLGGVGANAGWLPVPVLYPQRRGVSGPDADVGAWTDRLTVISAEAPLTSARLATAMSSRTAAVAVDPLSCGAGLAACGFGVNSRVLIADARVNGEWFTVTGVSGDAIDHSPASLASTYGPLDDARLMIVDVRAIAFDAGRRQLRLVTAGSDLPFVDGVSAFEIAWRGDPRPPAGPRPPPGEANCLVDADGVPRLPDLPATTGPWVDLTPSMLSDGPWCGAAPWRFDADLFRVRLVRVSLRLEDVSPSQGSSAPPALTFDVAPRNLARAR
jgi:prepilin-type N-terminal cleavage/methylation domain-containing protein